MKNHLDINFSGDGFEACEVFSNCAAFRFQGKKKRVYVATKSFMGLYRLFFSLTFSCWRQRDAIAEDSNVSIDRGQQTP